MRYRSATSVFSLLFAAATTVAQAPGHRDGVTQDPFVAAIEAMKHSVAPVACLEGTGAKPAITQIHGSALFISARGEFITAAHVIDLLQGERPCSIPAIFLPTQKWQPEAPGEDFVWFPFKVEDCTIKREFDAAKCTPLSDLSVPNGEFRFPIVPVKPELSKQPDGTQVAFTGFPLRSRDPLTSRAVIAAHRTASRGAATTSELILDHGAWTGGSGSPVYLSNGRVIGMIVERGIDQATGIAVVQPIESLVEMLTAH